MNSGQKTEAFTIRADAEKVIALDALAAQQDRSRNYIVNQAIDYLLELNQWQIDKIQAGQQAVQQKDFASKDQVEAVFNKYAPRDQS